MLRRDPPAPQLPALNSRRLHFRGRRQAPRKGTVGSKGGGGGNTGMNILHGPSYYCGSGESMTTLHNRSNETNGTNNCEEDADSQIIRSMSSLTVANSAFSSVAVQSSSSSSSSSQSVGVGGGFSKVQTSDDSYGNGVAVDKEGNESDNDDNAAVATGKHHQQWQQKQKKEPRQVDAPLGGRCSYGRGASRGGGVRRVAQR